MAATIIEVAKLAGVSPATVSRAFGKPDLLSERTRGAVLAAAERLGYTPNRAAKGLVTGKTGNIGILLPDIVNPFYPPVVKGATDRAAAADLSVFLATTELDPRRELTVAREMAKQVDGLVLCATELRDDEVAELAAQCAVVLVNGEKPQLPSVVVDTGPGMLEAVEHLAELGHSRFDYLSGPATSWSNERRMSFLRRQADRLGLRVEVRGPFSPSYDAGTVAADEVLASGASAVIAFDDQMALGVLSRLHELGIDVPGQVSVIGCDDVLPVGMARPALTTVKAPCARLGRAAVEVLLGGATEVRQQSYQGNLVIRDSTGPAVRRRPRGHAAPRPA
ncbi:LacI family DNA-binding transcriptional regulator [Sciscionella marina]|uniref:LacI family DNA-binding transcriptional regulator n=1 Tax=Sciscionella marina TaxID=508770 RepID=UPI00036CBA16|nr:LacI family DNA-binding transcriptional regulator [Sciscionella marina]